MTDQTATEQTALRDRIAEALGSLQGTAHHLPPETRQRVIEAVTGAVLPAPTGRAAGLREAVEAAEALNARYPYGASGERIIDELRRLAAEAQQDGARS
ncbi:hypothetical protein [Streptomyces coeruleorubidus]|uniref:hypothetical protein n=1 Tax=Streptomyces coeruleorubidus TaxID=116188 RepID=UPI0033AF2FDA